MMCYDISMYTHHLPYSVALFERLYQDTPPLFPREDREAMQHALEHVKHDANITHEEFETTLIVFGRKLWPYRLAFEEFVAKTEARRADEFFASHVRAFPTLEHWFTDWKRGGGHAADLFCGSWNHVGHLAPEERAALCAVLVETKQDVRSATATVVSGPEKESYRKRILELTILSEAIEEKLQNLRCLADDEQEHPQLVAELRQSVRDFEKGMAFLKKHTTFDNVCHTEARVPVRRKVILSLSQ